MDLPPEAVRQSALNALEDVEVALKAAKSEYYKSHFYEFNRDVLAWPDIYEPLHKKVCDFVQDNAKKKKLLILLPRGTFKSSIITIGYTLWRIAQNPSDRILIANATFPMAVQFLGQIKNHLQRNDEFKAIFGDLTATADSWREDRITVSREKSYEQKEPTVSAFGIGGNLVGSHFNVALLDDVVARENITTKDQIEKVKDFYKDSLDLVDANVGGHKEVILIGTTWHWGDLYAWIQDPDNGFSNDFAVLRMPAYEGEWKKGKLLFPKKLGWKQLAELKRQQGSSHFSAQYMLDPVPSDKSVFKNDFKRYEETDLKGLRLNKFVAVDPALSEKKEADYSAMICIGVDSQNNWYILDIWRDQVQPKRLLDQIFYWNEKWRPITFGVETTAFQKVLKYFLYEEMRRRNTSFPVKELSHTELSKDQRIRGLQPRYEMGTVFHPQKNSMKYSDYLEDELSRFPRGKNDDLIDALANMLEIAFPPKDKEEREHSFARNVYPA